MSAGEVMAAAEKAAAAPGDQRMEKPPAAVEVLPAVPNYDWGTVLTLVCFLFLFSHE